MRVDEVLKAIKPYVLEWVAGGAQEYASEPITADQEFGTTPEDVAGCTITKTLTSSVVYRWLFVFKVEILAVAEHVIFQITDASNTVLAEGFYYDTIGGAGASGSLEFVETGTGVSVTRKVRALCVANGGSESAQLDIDDSESALCTYFSVERTG
jgi:hypothetical protein